MNIPLSIILNRKIISSDVYKYQQSLAKRLIQKKRLLENTNSKKISSNYSIEKISKWLINLNIENRLKIFTIFNNWLTKIFFQMITYTRYESMVEFSPTEKYEELSKNKKNYMYSGFNNEYKEFLIKDRYNDRQNLDDFFTYFTGENNVKKGTGIPNSDELKKIELKKLRESELMKEIRFYSLCEFNDSLTFSFEFINNPVKMLEFFKYFSNEQCFTSIVNPYQDKNKSYNFSFPKWIYDYKNYSLHQLIMIFFEQIISIYYQLFLLENDIPKFDIDKKFSELFQTNLEIEEYLTKKVINKEEKEKTFTEFINKEDIKISLDSDKQKNLIKYYENKLEVVYSYAYASKYDGTFFNSDLKQIGIIGQKIKELMDLCEKNISNFINKICFVEPGEAFLVPNFLYYVLYHQLIDLRLNYCYNELLIEENDKKPNKNKKNKKRKKKKNNSKELPNDINNINIENNNNNLKNVEEKKELKNNNNNEEEEIEEIPIETPIEKKEELSEEKINNINNNMRSKSNSTLSSSFNNNNSKDLNSNTKYNNYFKGNKKEEEIIIKTKLDYLNENKNEEKKNEPKENDKIKLEDINENDVSEEALLCEDIYINFDKDVKKKKKKNKKRRKNASKNNDNNENNNKNKEMKNEDKNNIKEKSKEKKK